MANKQAATPWAFIRASSAWLIVLTCVLAEFCVKALDVLSGSSVSQSPLRKISIPEVVLSERMGLLTATL